MHKLNGPHYINVDLEVWSREDLAPFFKAAESRSFILYTGKVRRKFLVRIEMNSRTRSSGSPERTIWSLLKMVKALPREARQLWKRAESRVFSVGYESGEFITLLYERPPGSGLWFSRKSGPVPCETSFSPKLLSAVAKVGGTISTTIYPPRREVPSRSKRNEKTDRS